MMQIFRKLKNNYGSQRWWPTTKEGDVAPTYFGGPTTDKQVLEVIFGAILTQNTSWKNVEKAIVGLNKLDLIDIDKILKIKTEKLAQIIRPSGYYNQKALKLKAMCEFLKNNKLKELEKLNIKKLRELLLNIKGVGPETADSIILYAFNKPIFVVDAYTKRIFSRMGLVDEHEKYSFFQDFFHDKIKKNTKTYQEYHALIVEHAKMYCRIKPLCDECILSKYCKHPKTRLLS